MSRDKGIFSDDIEIVLQPQRHTPQNPLILRNGLTLGGGGYETALFFRSNLQVLLNLCSYGFEKKHDLRLVTSVMEKFFQYVDAKDYDSLAVLLTENPGFKDNIFIDRIMEKYDMQLVEILAQYGADLNNALHIAVCAEDLELTNLIISRGADINFQNRDEFTALHLATATHNIDLMISIIAKGADVRIVDQYHKTALYYLKQDWKVYYINNCLADYEKLKILLSSGPSNLPLCSAAASGDKETIKLLMQYEADLNVKDKDGRTPLHWAADCGFVDVVRMLMDAGADPNIKDNDGFTPLHLATLLPNYHDLLANLMFKDGIIKYGNTIGDLYIKDNDGNTVDDLLILRKEIMLELALQGDVASSE